ncbi:uncharacterized protein LOC119967165 isoform X2 [Scyliorhinus canicula]|uniref:uncharacterized protein LOC119967165 isoform X2 n=1 Tax=Scyliorhinus canicula TaxID=7830 RepID=UPI0018F4E807|nr:uncharacterized protein LOC119967165 isoform X2 [Scyliorhinus canicula]
MEQTLGITLTVRSCSNPRVQGDLGIDELLRKCEEILEKLRDPKSDPWFLAMAGTAQFQQAFGDVQDKDERIRATVEKVEFLWQQALARAQLLQKDVQCREKAQQIMDLITTEGMGKIHSYKLEIANNLSQAEILKLDYDVAIYNPAMKLIAESRRVLQDLGKITKEKPGGKEENCKEKLSRLQDMFRIAVELPRQTLKAVYDFYYIFEKVAGWYHLLLQEVLFKEAVYAHDVHMSRFPLEAAICLKPNWQHQANRFLNKAPLPAVEELIQLRDLADCIPDALQRRRGKLLSHQCLIARKLLTSLGQVLLVDLEKAIQWQEMYLAMFHRANSSVDTRMSEGATVATRSASDVNVIEEQFVESNVHEPKTENGFEPYVSSGEKNSQGSEKIEHRRGNHDCGHVDAKLQLTTFLSTYQTVLVQPEQKGRALTKETLSLSSFDSGIDGAGSCNFETGSYEVANGVHMVKRNSGLSLKNKTTKLSEEDRVNGSESDEWSEFDKFGFADASSASTGVQPLSKRNAMALNFEIKVSRSASLPKNPWISLPVEDLEKSYMVTITPKKPISETDLKLTITGSCNMAHKNEERSVDRLIDSAPRRNSLEAPSVQVKGSEKEQALVFEELDVQPVGKINCVQFCMDHTLNSTKQFDEDLKDTIPEVQCDNYELCGPKRQLEGDQNKSGCPALSDSKLYHKDIKEQEKLQGDIEKLLLMTAKILEEEEGVLRQEKDLEFLLQLEDHGDTEENSTIADMDSDQGIVSNEKVMMSLSELSEAGVIGLEGDEWPEMEWQKCHGSCTHSRLACGMGCVQQDGSFKPYSGVFTTGCKASVSTPGSYWGLHNNPRLLQELKELNQIEDRILEENLKLRELCSSEDEQNVPTQNPDKSNPSKDRMKFLTELERERKEVEKMEQSLAREEQMKYTNSKKLPQISSKAGCGHQRKKAMKPSAQVQSSYSKPSPRAEVKSQCGLTDVNLKSSKSSYSVNGFGSDSSKDQSCLKHTSVKIPPLVKGVCISKRKATRNVHCKTNDLPDPILGPVINNAAPMHKGSDATGIKDNQTFNTHLHAQVTPSKNKETIEDNESYTAGCKNQGELTVQTKEKPTPAPRTNILVKVENVLASPCSQQSSGDSVGNAVMLENRREVQLRVPMPKPRRSINLRQTKTCSNQCSENSSALWKPSEHQESSEFVGNCPVSKESKVQEPVTAIATPEPNPQMENESQSNDTKMDHVGVNSPNLSDSSTNTHVGPVSCKKDDPATEASSSVSTGKRKMCFGEKDSKLVVTSDVYGESKYDAQHSPLFNEAIQKTSASSRRSLGSREDRILEMLQSKESRSNEAQKDSLHRIDDTSHKHDCPNRDLHSVFEDCLANVSVAHKPPINAHIFQVSLMKVSDYNIPIVLDTGSGLMKAGFANQDLPTTIFPTVFGRPKYESVCRGRHRQDFYIGHDAQHMRGVLSLHYPLEHGIVTDWEEIEKIWHHTFYRQLRVDPQEHPILLTEAAMNPHQNRERMVEIMFEVFNVPFSYVAMQAVLALYSSGRTTGITLDSGDGVTHTVPVYEGYSIPHAIQRLNLAGRDLTEYLRKLLKERGYSFNTSAEREIVRDIKEKHCYVAEDYEAELGSFANDAELNYTLPDGQIITIGHERFRASEILFKPELIGRDHYGIHESLLRAIILCDVDIRQTFAANIILSGGNTMLTGISARVQKEISSSLPLDLSKHVHITSPANRDFTVWSGGAALANSSAIECAWISREEYYEFGPKIVHRKCF